MLPYGWTFLLTKQNNDSRTCKIMTKQLSQVMKKINDFNNNIADITIHQNKQP
jgi:hypothetical protein